MPQKGRSTQSIVNTFPLWSNIRTDEQSLGYQFLNEMGKALDTVRQQITNVGSNYFLPTSIIKDIDVYYRFNLPGDFVFTKEDYDDTEFIYTPPTVSGLYDGEFYSVIIAEDNDIESFWYTPSPDRISLEAVVSGEHFLASGYFSQILFNPPTDQSGQLHITNKVTIKVDSGTSFVGLEDDNQVRTVIVQLEGLTRQLNEVTEEIIFIHNETKQSMHEYSSIVDSGMRVFGAADPESTTIKFTSANFNDDDYPVNYELDSSIYGEDMPLFWALGSGMTSDTRTLDLQKYDTDDLELRIEGYTTKHTILQQELLNLSGSGITPEDLAIEPYSDNLWVVSSGNLYMYSSQFPYPNLDILRGKKYDASSVVEPNTYYAVINEEIELNYIWRRPTTGIVCHRVWVEKPNGTKMSLEDGAEVAYHTDSTSWVFGEPVKRKIRPSEFYTLDQRGNYIYALEVIYTDETTSVDKRVVSVLTQRPSAQFDLADLGITTTVTGVDFDSEEKLWIADASGVKYQINRHWDRMLVDFDRKIMYFREPYDQVRIY